MKEEYGLIIDIPSPDTCSYEERTQLRVNIEQEKFNDEHYLADLYDNDYISECLLTFEPFWYKINDDKSPESKSFKKIFNKFSYTKRFLS